MVFQNLSVAVKRVPSLTSSHLLRGGGSRNNRHCVRRFSKLLSTRTLSIPPTSGSDAFVSRMSNQRDRDQLTGATVRLLSTSGDESRNPIVPLDGTIDFATADLYDTYMETARVSTEADWKHYGGTTKFVGRATTVKCFEDNSRLKELAFSNPPGTVDGSTPSASPPHVLVVDAGGSRRCAVMGDWIAQTARDNGWAGVIIYGCVRDVAILRQINDLGVMALGSTPRKSTRRGEGQVNIPVEMGKGVLIHPGDYVFCDADGILVVNPQDYRAP